MINKNNQESESTQQMQCSRGLPTLTQDQRIGAIVHRVSHSHMKGHLSLPPFLSYEMNYKM